MALLNIIMLLTIYCYININVNNLVAFKILIQFRMRINNINHIINVGVNTDIKLNYNINK